MTCLHPVHLLTDTVLLVSIFFQKIPHDTHRCRQLPMSLCVRDLTSMQLTNTGTWNLVGDRLRCVGGVRSKARQDASMSAVANTLSQVGSVPVLLPEVQEGCFNHTPKSKRSSASGFMSHARVSPLTRHRSYLQQCARPCYTLQCVCRKAVVVAVAVRSRFHPEDCLCPDCSWQPGEVLLTTAASQRLVGLQLRAMTVA